MFFLNKTKFHLHVLRCSIRLTHVEVRASINSLNFLENIMASYISSCLGAHLHFGLFLAYVSHISHCIFILFKWYPPSHYVWLILAWSIYQISFNSLFYYLWKRAIVIQIYFKHWFKSWVFSLKCIMLQTVRLSLLTWQIALLVFVKTRCVVEQILNTDLQSFP